MINSGTMDDLKNKKEKVELRLKWDPKNSALLTKELYQIVEEHKAQVSIKAKSKSPLDLIVVITLLINAYPIIRDVKDWIKHHRERERLAKVKFRIIRRATVEEIIEEEEL